MKHKVMERSRGARFSHCTEDSSLTLNVGSNPGLAGHGACVQE